MSKYRDYLAGGLVGLAVGALLGGLALALLRAAVEQPEERTVRERISIDARDDSYLYNGADLYVYSDDHSTQVLHIDGATGNVTFAGVVDVNGVADAVVLDADADTTISAPTDDQIDIEIAGADDFTVTANALNLLAGSSLEHAAASAARTGVVFVSSGTVTYSDTSATLMFTLPANADIVDGNLVTTTAFAATPETTEHVDCGTTLATPNEFFNDQAASTAGVTALAAQGAFGDVGASDVQVYCLSNTTSGTAGEASLLIEWRVD